MARAEIGKHPYLWGAKVFGPNMPLDCSGFTAWVFKHANLDIGPGTWFQRQYCIEHGTKVGAPYQAGDLLFWMDKGPETPSHVGIATGAGTVVEETASFGANVVESLVLGRWDQEFIEGWRIL